MQSITLDLRVEHEDLTDRTYRILRDLIVTRAIPPGGKVTAESLSQRFGVSRTTVKSAIDQLASEGLVDVRPQVGTFVRGLTPDDVRALYDVRLMLELFAVQHGVLSATDEQRRELRQIADELVPLVNGDEYLPETYEHAVDLNRRLHQIIIATAHNSYLETLHRLLRAHVHIVDFQWRRGLRRADLGLEEHRTIVDAYERRDPDLAAATVIRHVERSRDVVLQAIARLQHL
ncbi:MAG TPA: GntR family transcriptional regulator [Chloroflexota bacterium]|nr:GntR family transcriptional regulator [Chloroflexota bacterium]